ncbi:MULTISPECIES: hypothetical protein [unclassified Variovorax]|uniref:hypothetical protein n=1 Tax=unclassified Variovorax TaxID=663243 RepID=UPI00076DE5A4|nr:MULTISPECIES: hypothetical protein [unclassified Variovorax]KWT89301.1 hypothetical protein APY03_3380 [Variovorax sp. WDL1]PNG56478.1 hypothetical protein CHC07_02895 [Variovorax sp. B4]PNG57901.1 hypothetical protein CHC06_02897 [Variovorax sp. B2]VTV09637.1 hypothetical protein WDL1CHR_00729 [Variovorax sp. WDL1]
MSETFDLFGEDAAPVPPQPQQAAQPAQTADSFMMQPCGVNLWTYRGVKIRCDMKLQRLIGHWSTVEPLGAKIAQSDLRVALCRAIDEHLGPREAA